MCCINADTKHEIIAPSYPIILQEYKLNKSSPHLHTHTLLKSVLLILGHTFEDKQQQFLTVRLQGQIWASGSFIEIVLEETVIY